ncbi:MAG: hypothetical protein ABR598_03060 [Candidatus Dormibacteria bacterium]
MRSRNLVITSVAVIVVVIAMLGTVGYGIYAGINANNAASHQGEVVTGPAPGGPPNLTAAAGPAGTSVSRSVDAAAPNSSAYINEPGPGVFQPGSPPFGQGGVGGDGISAAGVAYREVSDPNAQADSALIKAAYQDAEKKIADLGTATGTRVGKVIAVTDFTNNQPYYKPCTYNGGGPAIGKPVAPCQANSNHYLVVWVYVRHAIS